MQDNDKGKISVSMMCVSIDLIMDYLKAFERNHIELLHIDIMDGTFVPNITIGVDYVKQLRKLTNIPLDLCSNPRWYFPAGIFV